MRVRAVHLAGRHGQALRRRHGPARRADARVRAGRGPPAAATTRSSPASTTRRYAERFGDEFDARRGRIELLRGAAPDVRPRGLPRRPADAGVLRLGDQQLRRAGGARRAGRPGAAAAAAQAPRCSATVAARRAEVHRRRLQDPGQHGPGAPRPHRLRARGLGPLRARHAAEGARARARSCGRTPWSRFLSQRRELLDEAYRRRHHRHPEPRRAAARRHAHRGRGAAVHRPAVLRARDVPHASRSPTRCAPSSCSRA